jgi:sugar (pentulose or hexulose) kinase
MLANVDVTGTPVPTARFMGGREYLVILGEEAESDTSLAHLDAILAKGTLALPSFAPESGPFPGWRGRIAGPAPETAGERGVLAALYAALMIDFVLEQLGADGPIFIDGPFARNLLITDSLATLRSGQPVHTLAATCGAGTGALVLTRWLSARKPMIERAPARPSLAGLADTLRATRLAWRSMLENQI